MEQGQGSRGCGRDGMLCFNRNSFVVTTLWAGALSCCRIQLPERHFSGRLRTASGRCCRTVLWNSLFTVCPLGTYSWWTSPSMLKNAINMVLTLDFTCHTFFGWGDDAVFTGRTFTLFLGQTHKPSFLHQWLPRTWSWDHFGLAHGGQCKFTRSRPFAPPSGDGAQILLTPSHLQFFS